MSNLERARSVNILSSNVGEICGEDGCSYEVFINFRSLARAITETIHNGITGSEWVIFENSAHFPHLEKPEKYLSVLNDFIGRVESQ